MVSLTILTALAVDRSPGRGLKSLVRVKWPKNAPPVETSRTAAALFTEHCLLVSSATDEPLIRFG